MFGPFVHRIDPIFGELAGFYLWFYGLSYALGFISILLWFKRARRKLGLTTGAVYSLTIYVAIGVLVGGRLVEVFFYEWAYYRQHLWQIPAAWLGGMSTHGVLLGVAIAVWLFCRLHRLELLPIVDQLVIPGSYLMGMGRLGNFIDGQIVGSVTDVWWAVQFPDAPGFRHPVVLYDGAKNFLILGLLLWLRKAGPLPGMLTAHLIFWYGFLRIFVDLFREYPTTLLGIATGQAFNIVMSIAGIFLMIWFSRRQHATADVVKATVQEDHASRLWLKRAVLVALVLFSLTLPSDWTQDIPSRYGKRHPGMHYSVLYPRIHGNIPSEVKEEGGNR
jgi:phosphatidylglycerol:prolipoprotein diacylglycerol transferase